MKRLLLLFLASMVSVGCSSGNNSENLIEPSEISSSASEPSEIVALPLSSFSNFPVTFEIVRRLPTDIPPTLRLTTSEDAAFAPSGRGSFSAQCMEYEFDYTYQFNEVNSLYRLTIENVEQVPLPFGSGCVPALDDFTTDASSLSQPFFSTAGSYLSDLSNSHIHLFAENGEFISFSLIDDVQPQSDGLNLLQADWTVSSFRNGANSLTSAITNAPLTFRFLPNGTYVGSSTCYQVSGQYLETENQTIEFQQQNISFEPESNLCYTDSIENVAAQQTKLINSVSVVMNSTSRYHIDGQRLYLSNSFGSSTVVLNGRDRRSGEVLLETTILADSENGGGGTTEIVAIRENEEFQTLLAQLMSRGVVVDSIPVVDFDRSLILYLQLGQRPHVGRESITARSVSATDTDLLIEVDIRSADSDDPDLDQCGYDDAPSSPFTLVQISSDSVIPQPVSIVEIRTSACTGL